MQLQRTLGYSGEKVFSIGHWFPDITTNNKQIDWLEENKVTLKTHHGPRELIMDTAMVPAMESGMMSSFFS